MSWCHLTAVLFGSVRLLVSCFRDVKFLIPNKIANLRQAHATPPSHLLPSRPQESDLYSAKVSEENPGAELIVFSSLAQASMNRCFN